MPDGGLATKHKLMGAAESLSHVTHFNTEECRTLILFHQKIVACNGILDRLRFRDVLHVTFNMTDDIMLDLTFNGFDRDNDGYVDEDEWVKGLSFMLRGCLEELVDFVYFIYDMNGDRSLAREELYYCLKGSMHPGYGLDTDELEECEREIVEIAMKKLDVDRDGQITFEDFQHAVQGDPLMLQACGPCLPSPGSMAAFLSLVTLKYRSYSGAYAIPWSYTKPDRHNRLRRKNHDGFGGRLSHNRSQNSSMVSMSTVAPSTITSFKLSDLKSLIAANKSAKQGQKDKYVHKDSHKERPASAPPNSISHQVRANSGI